MRHFCDVKKGLRPGEIANGFAPHVHLLLGNENPMVDTAIAISLLVVEERATIAELEMVADKILVQAGYSGLHDVVKICKEVEAQIRRDKC